MLEQKIISSPPEFYIRNTKEILGMKIPILYNLIFPLRPNCILVYIIPRQILILIVVMKRIWYEISISVIYEANIGTALPFATQA